jgi:membrane-bound lytic murein transglycosylase D
VNRYGLRVTGCELRIAGYGLRVIKPVSRYVLQVLMIVTACCFLVCQIADAQTPQRKVDSVEKRLAELEKDVARLKRAVEGYHLGLVADTLLLCDKKIQLTKEDLRERFEREYFLFLENRGLLTILAKRYLKYHSMINEEIQKMSLPSDLIYLVVTESYLNPRAVSKANAAGLWQFMKETGKKEGLYVNEHVDERYNVKKATKSALTHLKRLYGEFGDWLIAMAAYNAGNGRLREAIENQGTKDFFELFLPEETERYIFRIVALKEILGNREKYGIQVDEKDLYKPVFLSEVSIEISKELHAIVLAQAMDLPYKMFRDFNLHLRKYRLPKGVYHINVPAEKKDVFLKRMRNQPGVEVLKEG